MFTIVSITTFKKLQLARRFSEWMRFMAVMVCVCVGGYSHIQGYASCPSPQLGEREFFVGVYSDD